MKNVHFFLSLILAGITFSINAQPYIYFDPGTCEATVAPDSTTLVPSVLHNFTEDTVEFSFPGFTTRDQGGPDSYGYSWIDSEEEGGPNWEWSDIAETGFQLEGLGDDEMVGPFEMAIDFPYYGQTKNLFWISPNGVISFNDQMIPYTNAPIPTNNDYHDFIAWFWDDLRFDTTISNVYIKNFEEKTIVQFTRMVHYPGGTESYITGQVIMVANGTIFFKYRLVSESFDKTSATVGLQSADSSVGLQVVYNAEYVHSELAVRFDLNQDFITTVNPSTLTLPPGTQETIWITYNSAGFAAGGYEQDLKCITSHPEFPHILHHNIMHVSNPDQAGFKGYVTDAATGYAINDVLVKVGEHQTYTNDNGYYELALEHGEYNVKFLRNNYQTLIIEDTIAMPGFSILDVELEGFYFIAGQVFAGENHIEAGFAYWYKMLEGTVTDIGAEMVGEMGWYEFSGLASAGYIIKAEPSPGSMYYGDYLPTYYGDVLHWEDAALLNIPPGTESAHIHLVEVVAAPLGPGSISGTIENAGRMAEVPVFLFSNEQQSVLMTLTSEDGAYSFSDLALGTYELFAEMPGKSITPETVILNEMSPAVEGIDMVIMENEIVFVLGIADSDIFNIVPYIYPNPVQDKLNIMIDVNKTAALNVFIYDPLGRIVSQKYCNLNGREVVTMDISGLSTGVYLMELHAGREVFNTRIIKY